MGLLDRQAKLSLQLEQPGPTPEALLVRVQEAFNFGASLPKAFAEGDAVRRRHIFHAVYANPIVRDRKALYKAKEPFSFLDGADGIQRWYPIVERLRTRIIAQNFQIPVLNRGGDCTATLPSSTVEARIS